MFRNRAERLQAFQKTDIYPVITEAFCAGRSSAEVCRRVLAGGARIVQLREKEKSKKDIVNLARQFRELTWDAQALLIINDHVDVALTVQADGVHVGQEDLPLSLARELAPELLIGVSTHSLFEAKLAETQGADYINLGPIFYTRTKTKAPMPLGLDIIALATRLLQTPFTVMGGIKTENIPLLLSRGATRLAMVTEITQAEDIETRVGHLKKMIQMHLPA